jgi:hypothetical protein
MAKQVSQEEKEEIRIEVMRGFLCQLIIVIMRDFVITTIKLS